MASPVRNKQIIIFLNRFTLKSKDPYLVNWVVVVYL
jgi:hypothetical protein